MSRSAAASSDGVGVGATAGGEPGGYLARTASWDVPTTLRQELIDLTARLREHVHALPVREGVAHVWSLHTTCAVFVTELQDALAADIAKLMEDLAPRGAGWRHDDPRYSDCDRRNADAHLRALLLGQSVTLPVSRGELLLGQWQRVLLGELDGPRTRTVCVQVSGIA